MSEATEPKKWYTVQVCVVEVLEDGSYGEAGEVVGMDHASTDYEKVQDIADYLVGEGEDMWSWKIDSDTQRVRDPEVYYQFNPPEDGEE